MNNSSILSALVRWNGNSFRFLVRVFFCLSGIFQVEMLERFHVSKWLTRENVEKNTQLFQLLNEVVRWSVSQKEQYWDSRYFQWIMNGVRRPGTKTQSFVFIPSSFWTSMVTCSYLKFQIRHMQIQIKCERTYNTIQFNNNKKKPKRKKSIYSDT